MEKKTEKETRKQNQNSLQSYKERSSKGFTPRLLAILLAPLVIIAIVGGVIWYLNSSNSVGLSTDDHIDITPTQIQEIQNIGQWEFLSINDEELIDTVSRGFFSDSELVRIYYGTVRLGIDLRQAGPQWLHVEGDSIIAMLPPITLLERNFIDEARTRSFFEKGTWTDGDREQLYKRAYRKMLKRCFTPENIKIAEENARQQFMQFLRSMGYKKIRVGFATDRK
ncbi:DUF4230 domain-containing protein [Prevotella histicola]|uniref:DUF4230 domain-containing protein n=1 Tax=Prevotella histicola TaxID=470565 RepID=UPI001CAC78AA|nr:DUF4230 domain-containing protein [Prevotella histicola]MBF1400252.1 DUF4230 domain-containing protein [Prevotella histicola]